MPSEKKSRGTGPAKIVSFRPNAVWNAAEERAGNIIGQRLSMERKRRGLTLEALRELLQNHGVEIQIQGLNKWEKGLTVPNAYQFIALCRILGIEDCMVGMEPVLLNDTGLRKLMSTRWISLLLAAIVLLRSDIQKLTLKCQSAHWLFRLESVNFWMKAGLR